MRTAIAVGAFALFGLAACSGMLADDATRKLQAQCAAEGKQFVPDKVEKHDNPIYSSAMVSGKCEGPGDPDYVAPPAKG